MYGDSSPGWLVSICILPAGRLPNVLSDGESSCFQGSEPRLRKCHILTFVAIAGLVLSCLLSRKGINRYVLEHRFNLIRLKSSEEGDNYVYDTYRNADSEQVAYLNAHYQPYGGVIIEATAAAAQTR